MTRLKLGFVLFLLGMVGALAVVPYAFTTIGVASMHLPYSLQTLMMVQIAFSAVILMFCITLGMFFAGRVGLDSVFLASAFNGELSSLYKMSGPTQEGLPRFRFIPTVALASSLGISCAVLCLVVDILVFGTSLKLALGWDMIASLNDRALAVLYSAFDEEILLRLFLLSAVAWLFKVAERRKDPGLSGFGATMAVLITAALSSIIPMLFLEVTVGMSMLEVARALLINFGAGVVYGWMYWQRGLVASMVTHGVAELMLAVGFPLILGSVITGS